MVMVKCPETGRAIPTGIETDRESFQRCAVFFARTLCPTCRIEHAWFAREAWVEQPRARLARRQVQRSPFAAQAMTDGNT
jgi:hypothetical protein